MPYKDKKQAQQHSREYAASHRKEIAAYKERNRKKIQAYQAAYRAKQKILDAQEKLEEALKK